MYTTWFERKVLVSGELTHPKKYTKNTRTLKSNGLPLKICSVLFNLSKRKLQYTPLTV